MKKLIVTFGIFLAGIVFVNAQDKAAAMQTKMVDRMTQVCGLTPDQVSKVQPIVAGYVKARQANKSQYANDPAGLKSANKKATEDYKSQLNTVLSTDQQAKLKAANEQMRAKRQGGGQGESGEHQ